jgi:peptide/nickel transport system substrate-binding protein
MKLAKALTPLLLVVALSLGLQIENAMAAPKKGGTVTFVPGKEPTSLVAAATVADPTIIISTKIHDSLVNLDKDGNPSRPGLAESWVVSPDGKTVTFKLRKGVKWHDGQDFTSDDVAFSVLALKKYSPRGKVALANVNSVDTPDAFTAVVNLAFPRPICLRLSAVLNPPCCLTMCMGMAIWQPTPTISIRSAAVPSSFWSGNREAT